jgi:hypothetical protein
MQIISLETGIRPDDSKEIKSAFEEFVEQTHEWAKKAMAIIVLAEDDIQGMEQAAKADKALRALQKEVEDTHKRMKADSLAYGRALDEVKRNFNAVIEPARIHCKEMASFAETMEKKRQEELKAKRMEEMKDLNVNLAHYDLATMPEDLYQATLSGLRMQKKAAEEAAQAAKKAAEQEEANRKAEEERLAAENKALQERAKEAEAKAKKATEDAKAAEAAAKARETAKDRQADLLKKGYAYDGTNFVLGDNKISPAELLSLSNADYIQRAKVTGNQDKALLLAYATNIKYVPKLKDAKLHARIQEDVTKLVQSIEAVANGLL